jgi:hypothetical protein
VTLDLVLAILRQRLPNPDAPVLVVGMSAVTCFGHQAASDPSESSVDVAALAFASRQRVKALLYAWRSTPNSSREGSTAN